MNYWDGQRYVPSDPSFALGAKDFIANRVQHRVSISADINQIGAVRLVTPDGIELKSTPVGIGLYDAQSGKSAIIGTIAHSEGVLIGNNKIVFENAFAGVCADIVYTLERGTFEQDIVFTGKLNVGDYGFPEKTTQIQIYTEFYGAPQPEKLSRPIYVEEDQAVRRRMASPDRTDETLGFGEVVIGMGHVLMPPSKAHPLGSSAVVAKEFTTIAGRTFLIESIESSAIHEALASLPECKARKVALRKTKDFPVAQLPKPGLGNGKTLPRKASKELAYLADRSRGVVVDYQLITVNLSGTTVFRSDVTYVVTGNVICYGSTIIEGGTVIKYKSGTSIRCDSLTTKTSNYRPAILTALDDDSVGQSAFGVAGYTGTVATGGYANPALEVYYSTELNYLRISYAQEGIKNTSADGTLGINHSQFLNCVRGINLIMGYYYYGYAFSLTVKNCLFSHVQEVVSDTRTLATLLTFSQCTLDDCAKFATHNIGGTGGAYYSLAAYNSIFSQVGLSGGVAIGGNYNGFYNSFGGQTYGSNPRSTSTSPFQNGGNGNYYLAANSNFRNFGSSTYASSVVGKTTTPPIAFPPLMEITGELTLFPQIPRYASGTPNLGYHYDPLDYTVAAMLLEGGSITVQPGTAVGSRVELVFADWWPFTPLTYGGFFLREGSKFAATGTPKSPITFVDVQLVQEEPTLSTLALFIPYFLPNTSDFPPPVLDFRFANFYASQRWYHFWSGTAWDVPEPAFWLSPDSAMNWSLRDCNLYGGRVLVGEPEEFDEFTLFGGGSVLWINNLFERVYVNLDPTWIADGGEMNVDLEFRAYNNLMRGGRLFLNPIPATTGNWLFNDNLFDKTAFEFYSQASVEHNFNGYWPRTASELGTGLFDRQQFAHLLTDFNNPNQYAANDRLLTVAPAYQSSTYGSYYLPTSSPLYNAGSRTPGVAGLYHYTTRTDQTKDGAESGNTVNIGLHYVAATSSLPKDADSDGIPDFLEDFNGNGQWDSDTETKIDAAQTDTGIVDSVNTKYDDIDLDGDGLAGSVEKALGRSPLASDNPMMAPQLVAGVDSETMALTVPLNFDLLANVGYLNLLVDSHHSPFLRNDRDGNGQCLLTWNTIYEQAGSHLFQLGITLNNQSRGNGSGPVALQNVSVDHPPYPYPLTPGSANWINARVEDRIASVNIPQSWRDGATSWQLFCSAMANPYMRGIWVLGVSLTDSYDAARNSRILAFLPDVEAAPDFGPNVLRFLAGLDPRILASEECSDSKPCILNYEIVGLDLV